MDSSTKSGTAAQTLDLDELMEKIRSEVAERKQLTAVPLQTPVASSPTPDFASRQWNARDLLALPPADFARAIHVAFFGREPSPDEFGRLRDRLLVGGVGRMRILREFHRSEEARARNLPVPGLTRQFIWDRISWSPPAKLGRAVGRGARNLWLLRRHIREFVERVEMLERRAAEISATVRNVQSAQVNDRQNTNRHVRRLQETIEADKRSTGSLLEKAERQLSDSLDEVRDRLQQAETRLTDHWRGIVEHKRGLEGMATALRQNAGTSGENSAERAIDHELSHLLDPLYISFEDRYRGTRADIKERQRVYLARVEAAWTACNQAPVVDIGCGRGEWLELLSEAGIVARGYDLNRIAIEESRARGLEVQLDDGLEALAAMPDDCCSVVTCFHVVEHLPFESVVKLLDESLRVLRPDGVLILETPNPANLLVATERFYMDPTHRNPLPSELTAYLLESRGFRDIELVPLHPIPMDVREAYSDPMLSLLREKLFGPQDYGAIGRKAA